MKEKSQNNGGHIRILNDIAEQFGRIKLSGSAWQILWIILRKTLGWNKKYDEISVTFFEKKTGLERRHIHKILKNLVERKIIVKNGTTFITTYGFNKNYNEWKSLSKMAVPKKTRPIVKNGTKTVVKKGTHIKTIKDTKQKTQDQCDLQFQAFWNLYPRKVKRLQAQKEFEKLNPSKEMFEKIITAVQAQIESGALDPQRKKYCPYPVTWLNGEQWTDETGDEVSESEIEISQDEIDWRKKREAGGE